MDGPARRQRRSHTKSHSGCSRCKRLRVKCDELQPKCSRCSRAGQECFYPPGVVAPSKDDSPSADSGIGLSDTESETALVPWSPSAFTPSPHGMPAVWERVEIEEMHASAQRVLIDTYRDGHLLNPGGFFRPLMTKLSFVSDMVRYAYLGRNLQFSGKRNKSLVQVQLADVYRTKAFALLRKELNNFTKENAEFALAASLCLMWSATSPQEYVYLEAGSKAVNAAIPELTGSTPFGLPSSVGFVVHRIPISSDEVGELLSFISNELSQFKRIVRSEMDSITGLAPALKNLEQAITNIDMKRKAGGGHKEDMDFRRAMNMMSLLPPAVVIGGFGRLPSALLATWIFYEIITVLSVLVSDRDETDDMEHIIYAAHCDLRVYQRLLEDGEFILAKAVEGCVALIRMFLDTGTMRVAWLRSEQSLVLDLTKDPSKSVVK